MLRNTNDIKLGSLIFTRKKLCLISWTIKKFLKFDYSHVAVYIGMGRIVESVWGGVKINPLSKYLSDDKYEGEVVPLPLSDIQKALFIAECLRLVGEKYDYLINMWSLISKILRLPRTNRAKWNVINAWRCSELTAYALEKVGKGLEFPACQITPKDLFLHFKEKVGN